MPVTNCRRNAFLLIPSFDSLFSNSKTDEIIRLNLRKIPVLENPVVLVIPVNEKK